MAKEPQPVKLMYELSSALTGYDEMALRGTGLGDDYLTTVLGVVQQEVVEAMLDAWASIAEATTSPAERLAAVKTRVLDDEKYGPLARSLIKLWFLGSWYPPTDAWHRKYGTGQNIAEHIVSDAAYVEGLVWNDLGAHPQAARWPGWATWSWPPRGTWQ